MNFPSVPAKFLNKDELLTDYGTQLHIGVVKAHEPNSFSTFKGVLSDSSTAYPTNIFVEVYRI